jgi:hypothetical protein
MKATKQSKIPQNFFLLRICNTNNNIIRVVDITERDVNFMKEIITDIYKNESGGITIILKLKSKYLKDEISN